jgi:3-phenylpropionate/trans-cinnamate dioxygenase ferredoxin subunit
MKRIITNRRSLTTTGMLRPPRAPSFRRLRTRALEWEPRGRQPDGGHAEAPREGTMSDWVMACAVGEIEEEDVFRFDHEGRTFAIYRSPEDEYFATDGLCTHEQVHLADGLVMGDIIECPKHNGRFNYKTGEARGAPVCVNLATYPVKVERGRVMVQIG